MQNNRLFLLILILLESLAVFGQSKPDNVSKFPAAEPFRITRGSSFAASAPNGVSQKRTGLSAEKQRELISAADKIARKHGK